MFCCSFCCFWAPKQEVRPLKSCTGTKKNYQKYSPLSMPLLRTNLHCISSPLKSKPLVYAVVINIIIIFLFRFLNFLFVHKPSQVENKTKTMAITLHTHTHKTNTTTHPLPSFLIIIIFLSVTLKKKNGRFCRPLVFFFFCFFFSVCFL